MLAAEQVCVLYAGVRGYLDKVDTKSISEFEQLYLEHLRGKHAALVETIHKERQLSEKTDADLKAILEDFVPNCGLLKK
jgi:F-type H+-transporting ATPase subunit alpha